MKVSSFVLDSIRRNNKITDYLASKNIQSSRQTNNQIFYVCPLHGDTKPSFIVYLPKDSEGYQTYFCWGCKSNRCIIELYSRLEGVTRKEAIKRLGAGLNITKQEEIDFLVDALKKDAEVETPNDVVSEISEISLNISVLGYNHYKKTDFDVEELLFLERLYKKVDETIWERDLDGLRRIYDYVSERCVAEASDGEIINPLAWRFIRWEEKHENETKECVKVYDDMGEEDD